jgi:hypothetical protein
MQKNQNSDSDSPQEEKDLNFDNMPHWQKQKRRCITRLGALSKYDRTLIFEHLLDWAILPTSSNFHEFCTTHEPSFPPSFIQDDFIRQEKDPDTKEMYENCLNLAKSFVAIRREELLAEGKMHPSVFNYVARYYDYYARQQQRSDLEFEHGLKNTQTVVVPEEYLKHVSLLMDQISSLKSELNMAKSSAINANKS